MILWHTRASRHVLGHNRFLAIYIYIYINALFFFYTIHVYIFCIYIAWLFQLAVILFCILFIFFFCHTLCCVRVALLWVVCTRSVTRVLLAETLRIQLFAPAKLSRPRGQRPLRQFGSSSKASVVWAQHLGLGLGSARLRLRLSSTYEQRHVVWRQALHSCRVERSARAEALQLWLVASAKSFYVLRSKAARLVCFTVYWLALASASASWALLVVSWHELLAKQQKF